MLHDTQVIHLSSTTLGPTRLEVALSNVLATGHVWLS